MNMFFVFIENNITDKTFSTLIAYFPEKKELAIKRKAILPKTILSLTIGSIKVKCNAYIEH